jgi:hypothetical protein
MKIEDLPDFPALEQLARALWREGTTRGAAVLVGAGFSRNAVRAGTDTPKPPLWSTLKDEMKAQLYRDPKDAPDDPLRLAEEYRTNFGQATLDEFVRTNICDTAWEPGKLHRDLLELPWADVLTTNWDTLLERTHTVKPRSVVRSTADLVHGHGGRIIKLHGTVGISEHFIFAEEDYRTYPSRFAAFVNTARQVFIENELCLLGFSGDDPNFLQWSGWVRDHLGETARRIYLVGALGLCPTKRKFLESRNIAPIDLSPLVKGDTADERQAQAAARFLEFLTKAKPKAVYDWQPANHSAYPFSPTTPEDMQRQAKDAEYAASLLDQAAKVWRNDRETYPGWLVCPPNVRQTLRYETNVARWQRPAALRKLEPTRSAEILYEIIWRSVVSFDPIDSRLLDLFALVADPAHVCSLEKHQQLEIALALLRLARQGNDDEGFARWVGVLETHAEKETDLHSQVAYQRCLRARDRLDLRELANEVKKIEGLDPIWKLRRAALHCEVGLLAEASALITQARAELADRQRRDNNSLWVRSRLAWAEWLSGAVQREWSVSRQAPLSSEFKEAHCDPETEIERITDAAAAELRKRLEENVAVIPLFDAGHYRDPSNTTRIQGGSATHLDTLGQLMESVGLPPYLNNFDMLGRSKNDAAELVYEPTFDWYAWLLRTLHSHNDRLFDRYFGRIAIARLPTDVADALSDRVTAAIKYWRERANTLGHDSGRDRACAIDQLVLFIEVLSRLTPRQDAERARATFNLAMEIARDPLHHIWLIEPISDLAKYSAQAVPRASWSELALAVLECPLSVEKGGISGPWPWLNPVESIFDARPARPGGDTRWAHRISELIREARAGGAARREAALRLYYLGRQGALTDAERVLFGAALWSATDGSPDSLPVGTNLLAHTFADLPAPDGIDRVAIVRARLFDTNVGELLSMPELLGSREVTDKQNRLLEIVASAGSSLRPTRDQALRLFSEMTSWRAPVDATSEKVDMFGLRRQFLSGSMRLIGPALSRVIVPELAPEDRTEDRARALLALIDEPYAGRVFPALSYFVHLTGPIHAEIVRRIRRGMIGRNFDEVAGSAAAVEAWADAYPPDSAAALPEQIFEQIISAVETRHSVGLNALIQAVRKLAELKRLRPGDGPRLDEALGDLIIETAYQKIEFDSPEATSVSLVRAECVKLARAMQSIGSGGANADAWLKAAPRDPLPEVRYAVAEREPSANSNFSPTGTGSAVANKPSSLGKQRKGKSQPRAVRNRPTPAKP